MKRFYKFFLIFLFVWPAAITLAETSLINSDNSRIQVFIKYRRLDWQTYEFSAQISDPDIKFEGVQWRIDNEVYFGSKIRYVFNSGYHTIQLKAKTETGDFYHDQMNLKIDFWSFNNPDLWWLFYGFLILMIVYYWIIKMLYSLGLFLARKQAQSFIKIFDDDPWQAELTEELLKKYLNNQIQVIEKKIDKDIKSKEQ